MVSGAPPLSPLELWGGVECTVVRIGDDYRDQVAETGHQARLGDIDAIADLGVKAVRYPILWESVAPQSPHELDFQLARQAAERLRKHGIEVIAGLVHHGTGPRYTNLLDPELPRPARRLCRPGRSAFSVDHQVDAGQRTADDGAVLLSLRPLVSASERMSMQTFRATVNECVAIARTMAALRTVNPAAELIVTEDLGKTFATDRSSHYQADHENERRWLSYRPARPAASSPAIILPLRLRNKAASEEQLDELARGEGSPDMHRLRPLSDQRAVSRPSHRALSEVDPVRNGRERYVDVEAVRMAKLKPLLGPAKRLREAWERYRLPIAITEVHHGCTRDEQVRWLHEVWQAAEHERARGADIRAVTVWAMFGSVDWRSVLTRREGSYDVGAFDTRSANPRPTLVAKRRRRSAAARRSITRCSICPAGGGGPDVRSRARASR